MPSDISPSRIGAASSTTDLSRDRAPAASVPASPAPAPGGKPFPNPSLRLDPGLALVVIEFRDESGQVRDTIPTQAQLEAYRSWDRMQSGDPPPGMPSAAARAEAEPPPAPPRVAATTPVPGPGAVPAMGVVAQVGGPPVPVVTTPAPTAAPATPPAPGTAMPAASAPVGQFKLSSTEAD